MKWHYKLVIAIRFLAWRIQREMPDDFWGWMYKRITDQSCKDYGDKVLVWVLLADALSENEHLRAAAIYEKFQTMIDESATDKYINRIQESLKFKREYEAKDA